MYKEIINSFNNFGISVIERLPEILVSIVSLSFLFLRGNYFIKYLNKEFRKNGKTI